MQPQTHRFLFDSAHGSNMLIAWGLMDDRFRQGSGYGTPSKWPFMAYKWG